METKQRTIQEHRDLRVSADFKRQKVAITLHQVWGAPDIDPQTGIMDAESEMYGDWSEKETTIFLLGSYELRVLAARLFDAARLLERGRIDLDVSIEFSDRGKFENEESDEEMVAPSHE